MILPIYHISGFNYLSLYPDYINALKWYRTLKENNFKV